MSTSGTTFTTEDLKKLKTAMLGSAGMSPGTGGIGVYAPPPGAIKPGTTADTEHILEMKKDIEVIKEAILAILADNMEIKNKQNAILEYYKRNDINPQSSMGGITYYSSTGPEPSNE